MKFSFLQRILKVGLGMALLTSGIVHSEVIDIDNNQLQALIDKGTAVIDIRRADEWQSLGILKGSDPITFFDASGGYDAQSWLDQAVKLAPKDQPLVLICLHGRRSKVVSAWLSDQVGYRRVYNVRKGLDHWIKAGNHTVALP